MQLSPAPLIQSPAQWGWLAGLGAFIICLQLLWHHSSYQDFIQKPKHFLTAKVIAQYPKNDYQVLKLQSNDHTFYTTKKDIDNLTGATLQILIFTKYVDIEFKSYLTHFYVPSHIIKKTEEAKEISYFTNQHPDNAHMAQFYNAIFLAKPISKELRQSVSALGVSHLIALSGFHLGILSAVLYFLLRPPYRFLQQRFFPYRHELFDLGLVIATLLGIYLFVTDFPPSLVRAYGMFVFGWLCAIWGVSILSFSFLFLVVLVLLVLHPPFLFSLGFYFSAMGVFYIYVLLDWMRDTNKLITTLAISFWTFLMMLPVTHYFFPTTSLWQLLSPLLTIMFSFFYPLALGLHVLGVGDLLQFSFPQNLPTYDKATPAWFYWLFLALSLLAIKDRFKPLLLFAALGFGLYLYML
ncbi:MAG: ComEC/Rec2 family competence protein [Campylobacterota bacterium]